MAGWRWQQTRLHGARGSVAAQLIANSQRQDWVEKERAGWAKMIHDAEEFLATARPGHSTDSIREMTYEDLRRWRQNLATLNHEAARLKLEFSDLEEGGTSSSVVGMETLVRQSRRELSRWSTEWNAEHRPR